MDYGWICTIGDPSQPLPSSFFLVRSPAEIKLVLRSGSSLKSNGVVFIGKPLKRMLSLYVIICEDNYNICFLWPAEYYIIIGVFPTLEGCVPTYVQSL
ncbi:hypothetical protein ACN38_g4691 [Penicillium nordicum]|uniref:Uncharacterized protein n=1 Tax=Penicillium nordicum TaxID=229535 RepID=A0A0N0RZ39_9EURO|nr:hypothetical protein ACN38_g4691 [Penicillium nordicum]